MIDLTKKTIAEKDDVISSLWIEATQAAATGTETKTRLTRVKEASRIVLEDACRLYATINLLKAKTFTDRYEEFKANVVLSNQALAWISEEYLKDLARCDLDAELKQVKKELDVYPDNFTNVLTCRTKRLTLEETY